MHTYLIIEVDGAKMVANRNLPLLDVPIRNIRGCFIGDSCGCPSWASRYIQELERTEPSKKFYVMKVPQGPIDKFVEGDLDDDIVDADSVSDTVANQDS